MGTITAIRPTYRHKDRVDLYVDDNYCCSLTAFSVAKARLVVGKCIEQSDIDDIMRTSENEIAFDKALSYISRSVRTVKQMRDYLTQKAFAESVIEDTINKLIYYKYLDDTAYASMYTAYASGNKGARAIAYELKNKGVDSQIIELALTQLDEDKMYNTCYELALKYTRSKLLDDKTINNLMRYLMSRGYEYSTVSSVVAKIKSGTDS
ncbi:MAG: RecX family transcriptional regulator [Clostridia bacterium]|nr:RecX family transcriptional regulator [Clostridia bacterium]